MTRASAFVLCQILSQHNAVVTSYNKLQKYNCQNPNIINLQITEIKRQFHAVRKYRDIYQEDTRVQQIMTSTMDTLRNIHVLLIKMKETV